MGIRVLCIGAHPDDCEGSVGGTATRMRRRGDDVKFVSVTDGSRGHFIPEYLEHPGKLVARRLDEARTAASVAGIRYECMGFQDGALFVDRETTEAMIRLIRREAPDLVLTNRPCDYHRDHRYTARLVLDATYMLTVPYLCPDAPVLRTMPVVAYWQDGFEEEGPFRADVIVPIEDAIEAKLDMMMAHESQYLEWLPYNAEPGSGLANLPEEPSERRAAVREILRTECRSNSGSSEAFQIGEYGRVPSPHEKETLFPIV